MRPRAQGTPWSGRPRGKSPHPFLPGARCRSGHEVCSPMSSRPLGAGASPEPQDSGLRQAQAQAGRAGTWPRRRWRGVCSLSGQEVGVGGLALLPSLANSAPEPRDWRAAHLRERSASRVSPRQSPCSTQKAVRLPMMRGPFSLPGPGL